MPFTFSDQICQSNHDEQHVQTREQQTRQRVQQRVQQRTSSHWVFASNLKVTGNKFFHYRSTVSSEPIFSQERVQQRACLFVSNIQIVFLFNNALLLTLFHINNHQQWNRSLDPKGAKFSSLKDQTGEQSKYLTEPLHVVIFRWQLCRYPASRVLFASYSRTSVSMLPQDFQEEQTTGKDNKRIVDKPNHPEAIEHNLDIMRAKKAQSWHSQTFSWDCYN